MASYNAIFIQVCDKLHKAYGIDKSKIHANAQFYEDLGINSLERAEMFFEMEEEFGVTIDENIDTVGDLVKEIMSYEDEQELG